MLEHNQFWQLSLARLRLFVREPEAVFWVVVFPLMLTMVLGWAFRATEPEPIPVVVLGDESAATAALLELLAEDPLLDVERSADPADVERRLRFGRISAYVEPGDPPRLSRDPQRPDAELARLRIERALLQASGGGTSVAELNEIEERGSRYIDWLFPGILGMNLMGTGIWGIGFAIADMRQKNLIRRMLVTPMRRDAFLMSFLSGRLAFLAAELAVIGGFGFLVLGVPMRGSWLTFLVVCFAGMLAFASLGILVVARARTIEGASGIMNFVVMPMWLLSGVFFSYERFPEALHPFVRLLPLTALNDALRGNALEAAGLTAMLPEFAVLAAWTLLPFLLALKIFRWD